ncbi:MAG TPA: DUF2254 domain-containing protein [Albitalea sp.]
MIRLRSLWLNLLGSLWFVPSVLVLLGVAAALLLVELHPLIGPDLSHDWPRLFGAGAEGARGMLSAIATSMITVAGVVYSVTIVALSLAASQYSPRVLRNFMSDRPTQVVLGAFVAVFAYCLIVLRTIRGSDEGAFVPSLAVLGGVFMAFVGIGLLIYFVHHVARAIQVDYIVQRIVSDTSEAIDRLFPGDVGEERPIAPRPSTGASDTLWEEIAATRTGYLVAIDASAMLALAIEQHTVLQVLPQVGEFVVAHRTLARVAPGGKRPQGGWPGALTQCLTVQGERNVHQDPAYGLQQLVDVALKALSPGVHDPTTAVSCVDHLGALLHRLSGRRMPGGLREHQGHLRLIFAAPGYEDFVHVALSALTHHAGSHEPVHARLLAAVESAADASEEPGRLAVLARQLDVHVERLADADLPAGRAEALRLRATVLRDDLRRRITGSGFATDL